MQSQYSTADAGRRIAVFARLRFHGAHERLVVFGRKGSRHLGWLPDGCLLAVSMRDLRPLRVEPDGALAQYADLASVTRDAANDMFVDAKGHAWVGSFGFDFYAVLEADPNADPLFGPGANRLQRLSRMSRRMARYRLRRRGCVFRAAPCNCRTARS